MSWRFVCVSSQEKLNVWAVEICIFYRKTQFIVRKKVKWGKKLCWNEHSLGMTNIVCVCVCVVNIFCSISLTASCHIMAWLNFSFIVDKTTKTSDGQNIANPMRVFHRSAIDSIFCSVSFPPKIKVVFAKRLQIWNHKRAMHADHHWRKWAIKTDNTHIEYIYTNEIN